MDEKRTLSFLSLGGFIVALSFPAAPGFGQTAKAEGARWHWIEVEAADGNATGWEMTSGTASVRIAGGRFHADLLPGPNQSGADISLDGLIGDGQIRATEVLLGTDAAPAIVTGTVHRQPIGGRLFEERITFRGGQSGDASFLGLYRR